MKKAIIMFFGLLLVSGIYAEINPMSFGINFGMMTPDTPKLFDTIWWTAGAELDFKIGNYLMLSPEVTLAGYKFKFKQFILYPAAILNFTASNFFIGGGITKGFSIGEDVSESSDIALKLNTGFKSRSMKLTAYLITDFDSLFDGMLLGASLGFMF